MLSKSADELRSGDTLGEAVACHMSKSCLSCFQESQVPVLSLHLPFRSVESCYDIIG